MLRISIALVALAFPASAAAAGRPDLRVTSTSVGAGSVIPGATVKVGDRTKNAGRKTARRSTTAYFLQVASRRVRLASRSVAPLKRRKTSRKTISVRIPTGTAAGSFFVIACADSKKKVRESNERNNCRGSSARLTVLNPDGSLPGGGTGEPGGGGTPGGGGGTTDPGGGGTPYVNPDPPVLAGCQIMPSDNEWNRDISGDEVDPMSDAYIKYSGAMVGQDWNLRQDWGDETSPFYGIPWIIVPQDQATLPIQYGVEGEDYGDESDPGPYPFPQDIPIEGADPPSGDGPAGEDRHAIALRQGTCDLFETFWTTRTPPGFTVTSSAHFDLASNATRPESNTSADAAGLPILPGLAKSSEIAAGKLRHALRFTVPKVQAAWQAPATHYGTQNNPCYPPYGARVRLKAGFDISGFTGQSRVIAEGLKTFGLMLADQGSSGYISGTSDAGWNIDDLVQLRSIHGTDLEFVKPRGPVTRRYTPPADPAC